MCERRKKNWWCRNLFKLKIDECGTVCQAICCYNLAFNMKLRKRSFIPSTPHVDQHLLYSHGLKFCMHVQWTQWDRCDLHHFRHVMDPYQACMRALTFCRNCDVQGKKLGTKSLTQLRTWSLVNMYYNAVYSWSVQIIIRTHGCKSVGLLSVKKTWSDRWVYITHIIQCRSINEIQVRLLAVQENWHGLLQPRSVCKQRTKHGVKLTLKGFTKILQYGRVRTDQSTL